MGAMAARKWRKDNTYVGGPHGNDEPFRKTGSADLYGTGACVTPLTDWQRKKLYTTAPKWAAYVLDAWYKRGHLTKGKEFSGYAKTVEEGIENCNRWLDEAKKRGAKSQ